MLLCPCCMHKRIRVQSCMGTLTRHCGHRGLLANPIASGLSRNLKLFLLPYEEFKIQKPIYQFLSI